MSELLKSKHMLCALVGLIVIVGFLVYMSWTPDNGVENKGGCGCSVSSEYEGLTGPVSPSLQSMARQSQSEALYTPPPPKEKLVYANPPREQLVPNRMMAQMNRMKGSPVAKTMNRMQNSSPWIG